MKPSAASGVRAPPVETVRSTPRMASVVDPVTAGLASLGRDGSPECYRARDRPADERSVGAADATARRLAIVPA